MMATSILLSPPLSLSEVLQDDLESEIIGPMLDISRKCLLVVLRELRSPHQLSKIPQRQLHSMLYNKSPNYPLKICNNIVATIMDPDSASEARD